MHADCYMARGKIIPLLLVLGLLLAQLAQAEAAADITLDDWAAVSARTPNLVRISPASDLHMEDLYVAGGIAFRPPSCLDSTASAAADRRCWLPARRSAAAATAGSPACTGRAPP